MKKRHLLLTAILALCGCNQQSQSTPVESEQISESSISESVINPELMQTIIENNQTNYNVVVDNIKGNTLDVVNSFISKFKNEYGITLQIIQASEANSDNEIIIGNIKNNSLSANVNKNLTPTAYGVVEKDGKIVVGASDDVALKEGLAHLLDNMLTYQEKVGIEKGYEFYGDAYMDNFVPKLTNTYGEYEKSYYSGDENYQIAYKEAKYQDFHDYGKLLEKQGFSKVSYNEIGENYFASYVKGTTLANVSFYYNSERLHMVYGKNTFANKDYSNVTKVVSPTISHIQRYGSEQSSPGLSIVCQLIDGSYIIVDGGPSSTKDEEILIDFLNTNNPNKNELPKVRWMFTHAHHDHMNLAVSFLEKYHDQIDMELFAYNFPDFNSLPIPSEPESRIEDSKNLIAKFETIYNTYYSDVERYKFHAGDKISLPGCEIEIFLTHETFWPQEFSWINHTSSAFKIKNGNKTMLVLGDCEQTVCEYLAKIYGMYMKSDILQVTHHGLNGGYIPLYEYVDPSICLWAIDGSRFETSDMCLGTKYGFEYNAWLRNDSIRERIHYHASETTTIVCE